MAGLHGGEQVALADRLDPVVPGPHPGPAEEDAAGRNRIDMWGVWQCTLCELPVMQNIPCCYREIWAAATGVVFKMIQEAEGGIELERGLKWLLILPKAVFRQGRRGGKAGKGMVAQRINCLVREDWGGLLALLERDTDRARQEDVGGKRVAEDRRARERLGEEKEKEKKRRNALSLLSKGLVSKSVRGITSFGIGDMENPNVRRQMSAKYPERGAALPAEVPRGQCVDNLRGLGEELLSLKAGVSPGTGGMRPEFLTCMVECWEEEDMGRLEDFGMRYLAGDLPVWWYKV